MSTATSNTTPAEEGVVFTIDSASGKLTCNQRLQNDSRPYDLIGYRPTYRISQEADLVFVVRGVMDLVSSEGTTLGLHYFTVSAHDLVLTFERDTTNRRGMARRILLHAASYAVNKLQTKVTIRFA